MKKSLIYFIAFTLCCLFSCKKRINFGNLKLHPSVSRFGFDYSDKISGAKQFAESFLNAYRDSIITYADSKYIDSFHYTNFDQIELVISISNTRDLLVEIRESRNPRNAVLATELPLQTTMLYNLDIFGKPIRPVPNLSKILNDYDKSPGMIAIGHDSFIIFENDHINGQYRAIQFYDDSSMAMLINFSFGNGYTVKGLGFLTSAKDIADFNYHAFEFAGSFMNAEIKRLFFESPFFKRALAYDKLYPYAKLMQEKYLKSKANGNYDYTFVDFEKDYESLLANVAKYGLKKEFADKLIKEAKERVKIRSLFWVYSDFWGFTQQWILCNIGLILLMLAIRPLYKKYIVGSIKSNFFKHYSPSGIVLGINGWIFKISPENLPYAYWIIPGILFIIVLVLAVKWFSK